MSSTAFHSQQLINIEGFAAVLSCCLLQVRGPDGQPVNTYEVQVRLPDLKSLPGVLLAYAILAGSNDEC